MAVGKQMFIVVIHNNQKTENNPDVRQLDEWINQMWYIHTVGYYLTKKRSEVLRDATEWMNLKNIMLKVKEAWYKGHILCDSI